MIFYFIDKLIKLENREDIWNNPMDINNEIQNQLNQMIEDESLRRDAAKVIEIKMKIFKVDIFYLELVIHNLRNVYTSLNQYASSLNNKPFQSKRDPSVDKSLYKISFLIIYEILQGKFGDDENNSILIFLPGINEINEMENTIISCLEKFNPGILEDIRICPLHSGISEYFKEN